MRRRAWVQIAVATLLGNSLRQTVHTHCASVHQASKVVAALLRVAGLTAGLVESNDSLPPGLWFTSPAGWLPKTGISSGTLHSVIKYGLRFTFYIQVVYVSILCKPTKHKRVLCWLCSHSMLQVLCNGTVSVCLSVPSTRWVCCSGSGRQEISIISGGCWCCSSTAHSKPSFSSKCKQCHVVS